MELFCSVVSPIFLQLLQFTLQGTRALTGFEQRFWLGILFYGVLHCLFPSAGGKKETDGYDPPLQKTLNDR